jgi:hypothetical protein
MVLRMLVLRIAPVTCLAVSGFGHGSKSCSGRGDVGEISLVLERNGEVNLLM